MREASIPGAPVRVLHLAVLVAFAVAQPLFDLLAANTEFLVAHGVDRVDLALLTIGVGLVIPALGALAVSAACRIAGPGAPAIHLLAVALLTAAIALPVFDGFGAASAFGLSALAGGAAAFAYARVRAVRRFVTLLSVALVVFPLRFGWAVAGLAGHESRAAGANSTSDAPVVVLVFDALPLSSLLDASGDIDARLYPHFAALAERAHWFVEATAVAERTTYAVPALLTGRYPETRRPATAAEYPQNLFTLLGESHVLNVVEPFTALCPATLCNAGAGRGTRAERWAALGSDLFYLYLHVLLPAGAASGLPDVGATWRDFAARAAPDAAQRATRNGVRRRRADVHWIVDRFLDPIVAAPAAGSRPQLNFLHLNLPHRPYRYLPSGAEYGPVGPLAAAHGARKGVWGDDAWEVSQALQRHLLQLRFADAVLGRVVERLQSQGLYDAALIAVTADHGVSFRTGGSARQVDRAEPLRNAGDVLRVPLFVKLPAQREGVRSDRNVETIDLLPTLIAALGGQLPAPVDGRDALDPGILDRPDKRAFVSLGDGTRRRLALPRDVPLGTPVLERLGAPFAQRARDGDLFRIGPNADLLGRSLGSVPAMGEGRLLVKLADAEAFRTVDPDGPYLPAHVAGELEGAEPEAAALELAVSVNGAIRAVTRSYTEEPGRPRFTAMLPSDALREGPNDVRVFAVRQRAGAPWLEPTQGLAARAYTGVADFEGNLALVYASDGRIFPVVPGAVDGAWSASGPYFSGQAVDARRGRAADSVLLFDGGRLLYAHPLALAEPGVERPGLRRFHFPIPYGRLASEARDVRFVALASDAAGELPVEGRSTPPAEWSGGGRLEVERRKGREGLAFEGGAWLAFERARITGGVDALEPVDGGARLRGWATDLLGEGPPAAVLIFAGERFLAVAPVDRSCPDAPDSGEASLVVARCFAALLPAALLGPARSYDLRVVVAFADGTVAAFGTEQP